MMDRVMDEIRKFNEERDWDQFHTPVNLAKSIAIEAGELRCNGSNNLRYIRVSYFHLLIDSAYA